MLRREFLQGLLASAVAVFMPWRAEAKPEPLTLENLDKAIEAGFKCEYRTGYLLMDRRAVVQILDMTDGLG